MIRFCNDDHLLSAMWAKGRLHYPTPATCLQRSDPPLQGGDALQAIQRSQAASLATCLGAQQAPKFGSFSVPACCVEVLIPTVPRIREAVRNFPYPNVGDYRVWPGPNSNTFVTAIMSAVPEMAATLPPTAIGKDFPVDRRWIGLSPSRTGIRINLGGYGGFTLGWVEGVEVNMLSAVAGLDFRRPALKLPGLGRLGLK
jgi:hypothetical protein